MNEASPQSTYHGLPLTAEQDRQVTSYIQRQKRANQPWDTAELHAMLVDMLDPPELAQEGSADVNLSIETESATASHEEPNQLS
jgi:DTW domain-containing protein YfiP